MSNVRSKSRETPNTPEILGTRTEEGYWNTGENWLPRSVETFSGTLAYTNEAVSYETHKGPPFKEGGPFSLRRYSLNRSLSHLSFKDKVDLGLRWQTNEVSTTCFGDFSQVGLPNILSLASLSSKVSSVSFPPTNLATYGNAALTKVSPLDLSEVNLVQSLVELYREGLPSIPGAQTRKVQQRMRAAGSEFLNVQFGWKPIISDIKNIYSTYQNMHKMYQQIVRDNNRPVRRRVTLFRNRVVTPISTWAGSRVYPGVGGTSGPDSYFRGPTTALQSETTRVWTVGRGRYYIPDVGSVEFHKKFVENLYGTSPNPAVLYELMPWSWLIDWFSNVGEVIQYELGPSLGQFVLDYCYLMRSTKREIKYNSQPTKGSYGQSGGKHTYRSFPGFSALEVFETKERIVATPFGFGLKLTDLSSRQLAILSALGLSKQKFL